MKNPGISVAMCTFNGERFLAAQLQSIAAQNRPPDEIVICDDRSSDGSRQIVEEFRRRTPIPVRLVVNGENLGSTKNFEQAISLCSCGIVALADQDDIWYPHKLERIEKAFLGSQEIVAAFSDADLIDDNSRPLGSRLWPTFSFDPSERKQFGDGKALEVLIRHPVVTGAAMAFRRDLFALMSPIPAGQVHDRWISFLLAVLGRYQLISEPLMQYRQHVRQQIGPGPLTLQARVAIAKSRGAEFYAEEIKCYRELYHWLVERKNDFPNAEHAQVELEKKISHLEHRALLSSRIPKIFAETLNGNYWRYSGGWISIVKDLLFRRSERPEIAGVMQKDQEPR